MLSIDLPEIQSLDPLEVAEHKVKAAFEYVGSPVLVEDTSLSFEALNGLPGTLIKWFLQSIGTTGLCNLLQSGQSRNALATTIYVYFDGAKNHYFTGELRGNIASSPLGKGGMGWDSIFIPEGMNKTRAELTRDEDDRISPRMKALDKLQEFFNDKSKLQS